MAEEKPIINVEQTSYDLEEKWLKTAAKYFDINLNNILDDNDIENSKINMLKAGLFGYVNEVMSNEVKNSVAHRNTLYDEFFINTASFPESIYRFAKAYNVPMSLARPSHMKAVLSVRKSDLLNSSLKTEIVSDQNIDLQTLKTYQIRMNKSYPFQVGKFEFSLPYDVIIKMKQNKNGDYTITARYDNNENLFDFSETLDETIKVYKDITNGDEYVYFVLDLYQTSVKKDSFSIMTDDISENLFYTVSYEDQLAGFNIYYTENGKTEVLTSYFNNTYQPSNPNEKYCYYTFLDDNKLQISFPSMIGGFKPAYNSLLEIETLTSKGDEGNFTYEGEISYSFSNSASEFSAMLSSVYPATSASGGKDRLDTMEEKQKIITALTTRDSLIMQSDLDNYFKSVNIENSVNGSTMQFLKKRDDLIKRVYSAFLLMRDKEGKVLPSNTAPRVKIPLQYFVDNNSGDSQNGYIVPEHSLFRYNVADDTYTIINSGFTQDIQNELDTDKDNLLYANPFLLKIDVDPVLNGTYYKLDLNEEVNLSYTYTNDLVDLSVILNTLSITKSVEYNKTDMDADTYTFKININSNQTANELDSIAYIRLVLLSSTGEKYGYFDLEREISPDANSTDSSSQYIGRISTDRKFNNGKLSLSDSLYDEDGNIIDNVFIDEDVIIKIGVLMHDPDRTYKTSAINSNEVKYFYDSFPSDMQNDHDINDYVLITSVTSTKTVKLYDNLSNIMSSTIQRDESSGRPYDQQDFIVEMVPLIGLDYFANKNEEIFNIINSYIEIIDSVTNKLENNTTIDLKFINSRGPSKYYYLDTGIKGDQIKYNLIGRTDILFDFEINLYEPATDTLDTEIKQFISDFLESCNTDGIVPISNLMRLLESNFSSIRYINFNGLTGKLSDSVSNKYQRILRKDINLNNMSKQEVIDYVPEYINVKKTLVDSVIEVPTETNSNSTSDVSLGKRFVNTINITYNTLT